MRVIDPNMQAALSAGVIVPAILLQVTFVSGPQYVWTGVGPLVYGGNTYTGVGSLGQLGTIAESIQVRANGTSVTLSGIDPTLYADCMNDIQLGAPAKVYFALLTQGTIIGAPQLMFSGMVDKPTVSEGGDTISITLALETRMTNLQRPNVRRYTAADQRIAYPTDSGFNYQEQLNDVALVWG